VASRLIRYRASHGITQKTLAKKLGVDPSTLARWERGDREPTGLYRKVAEKMLGRRRRICDGHRGRRVRSGLLRQQRGWESADDPLRRTWTIPVWSAKYDSLPAMREFNGTAASV
jgi:DNA-binding XRE family transcriptional regulator